MFRRPENLGRMLWGLCALAAVTGGIGGLWARQPEFARWMSFDYPSLNLMIAGAYVIAFFFCSKIQADYPADSGMRFAWRLIAASSAFSVFRYVIDWIAVNWRGSIDPTLLSLRQIPIALALILLTGGLVAMWTSFTAIGLGTRLRKLDLVGFAATAVCVPFVFSLREGMADSHSGYAFIRHIQSASPVLLAAPALAALALHRISHEMGDGTLAVSLRLLAVSLVMRLVALWIGSSTMGRDAYYYALASALYSAAPWIFVQAIFQRWSLTVKATRLAERYKRDPDGEMAELSRRLDERTIRGR